MTNIANGIIFIFMKTIKAIRNKFGLTQEDMGKLMGMTQAAISRIESGRRHETKLMLYHLAALEIVGDLGLFPKLMRVLDD